MKFHHNHLNIYKSNIMYILLVSFLVALSSGRSVHHHHGDGHDDNCVDISKYSEVQFNTSTVDLCSYKVTRDCSRQEREVCVSVPVTTCEVVGYPSCTNIPTNHILHDDATTTQTFTKQTCAVADEKQTITEVKQMPVCTNVTKEQCDSKWVINGAGEKVWAGNENCREVTWEDCHLVDREITQEIDVYICTPDTVAIEYEQPLYNEVDVTIYQQECEPRATPVCSQTSEVKCVTVEWEECQDSVHPKCFPAHFNIPYQTYDHRLRCTVDHH